MNRFKRFLGLLSMFQRIASDVQVGARVFIGPFVNLYGCTVGDDTKIGSFVEIQRGASVGKKCKIGSHSFIPEGVTIKDNVFLGHGVMFVNDNHPSSTRSDGALESRTDWNERFVLTVVHRGVSIGSGAVILGGITIGEMAVVGAGAVVTSDVAPGITVVGNPARQL